MTKGKLYSPLASVAITICIYLAAQLVAGVLIAFIPAVNHWHQARRDAWFDNAWTTFLFVAAAEAVTLWLVYKFLQARQLGFRDLGLRRPAAKHLAYALSGFAVYFVLYIVALVMVKQFIPHLDLEQKQDLGFSSTAAGSSLWPIFISLVILPPITEEIVVRGFLFGGLRTKLPFIKAAIIASIIFAAAHLGESGGGGLLWVAGIDTFVLSLVLCYLREHTESLWPSIGVHMIKNGLAFLVLYNIFQYFH